MGKAFCNVFWFVLINFRSDGVTTPTSYPSNQRRSALALNKVETSPPVDPQVKPQVLGAHQGGRERRETPNGLSPPVASKVTRF